MQAMLQRMHVAPGQQLQQQRPAGARPAAAHSSRGRPSRPLHIQAAGYEPSRQPGGGGVGQQQRQNLPVPVPPPPPPPPPAPQQGLNKRNLVAGGLLLGALALGAQLSKGALTRIRGDQQEAELGYIASQLRVQGVAAPVSPVLDKQTGRAVALVALGQGGKQYLVTVDPQRPSRLLLQDTGSRALYALQTRVDRVNIDNSLAMERLFGAPGWEAQLQQQR